MDCIEETTRHPFTLCSQFTNSDELAMIIAKEGDPVAHGGVVTSFRWRALELKHEGAYSRVIERRARFLHAARDGKPMTETLEIKRPSRASRATRPLKVLDLTEFWSERGGGVRSYLTTKAQALSRLGVEHVVLAAGAEDEETKLAECSKLVRLRGPALPYDPSYHWFLRFGAVRERVLKERPDVLEVHSPELAGLSALTVPQYAYGVRTFVWHSDFIDTYLSWRIEKLSSQRVARALTAPLWGWVRALGERSQATIVASGCQARKLEERGVPRIHELPFGVDTRIFSPRARDTAFRASVLGNRDVPFFVCSGRHAGEKRWDVLLEGFRRFRSRHEAVLLVYGDGPERARLEAQAERIPDVYFMGFDRDRARLAQALASAEALVHAGPFETFGLAVAEAVACGTPVVVSSSGAARELRDPACSEEYVWADPDSLASALERLLARDREVLRARALEAAARVVSIDQHFAALVALYAELLV